MSFTVLPPRLILLLCASFILALSGCSIQMQHDELTHSPVSRQGELQVHQQAENIVPFKRVGWGRGTIFAIPFVPIHVQGDVSLLLVEQIHDALTQVGYSIHSVDAYSLPDAQKTVPLLKVHVNKYRFSNYTYFFPIVPTWGGTNLHLLLQDANGNTLWRSDFEAGGATLNFFNGYTSASRKSMTRVLNQMVTAFAGDDFFTAVTQPEQARDRYLQHVQQLLDSERTADHRLGTQLLVQENQPGKALLDQAVTLLMSYNQRSSSAGNAIQLDICNALSRLNVLAEYRDALNTTAKQSKNSKARACVQQLVNS